MLLDCMNICLARADGRKRDENKIYFTSAEVFVLCLDLMPARSLSIFVRRDTLKGKSASRACCD
jgi:hypothetical protein